MCYTSTFWNFINAEMRFDFHDYICKVWSKSRLRWHLSCTNILIHVFNEYLVISAIMRCTCYSINEIPKCFTRITIITHTNVFYDSIHKRSLLLCFDLYQCRHDNEWPNVNCLASTILSCIFPAISIKTWQPRGLITHPLNHSYSCWSDFSSVLIALKNTVTFSYTSMLLSLKNTIERSEFLFPTTFCFVNCDARCGIQKFRYDALSSTMSKCSSLLSLLLFFYLALFLMNNTRCLLRNLNTRLYNVT